jgi:RHS repeat-associated protein
VTVKNPLGNVTTTLYNAVGWVRTVIDPLGNRLSMSYDNVGQRTAVIDPKANRTSAVYDPAGRITAVITAITNRTSAVYDAATRLTALVDARGNRYSFGYDKASRQVTQTDPLNRVTSFGYNTASEHILRIDARGNRCSYTFDSDSRLTGTRYPDATRVTMGYDAVGNRRFLADSSGRYTTLYDSLNRARAVATPAGLTISLTFDATGRRRTLLEPSGGTFTYGYDLANRSTLVVNPQSERTSWSYDANGRLTLQRLSNLVRVSMAYDAADRLLRLANITSTGTTITSFRDTWDGAGNRLARTEADGTLVTWSYDATYQLTRERRSGANSYDTTYSYDAAGNRRVKLDNAVRTTYTCDAANQLTKYVDNTGTTTFTYDATGNQRLQIVSAGGGTTTNTWDFENRLIKVALPNGTVNTFTYNGDGQRVERQDSKGTLIEVWDGQKILLETDGMNSTQVIYTLSPALYGDIVSQRRLGVSRYFVFDPLGSASRLTDGNQNVTDSYLFKAFGESLLAAGPTTNPFGFMGRLGYYFDPDLTRFTVRARVYAPGFARWISQDPIGFWGGDVNLSRYVGNRPTKGADPRGTDWWNPFTWFSWGPDWGEAVDEELAIVKQLNQLLGTHHSRLDQFTAAERAKAEEILGQTLNWPESAMTAAQQSLSNRQYYLDKSEFSLKVSATADVLAGTAAVLSAAEVSYMASEAAAAARAVRAARALASVRAVYAARIAALQAALARLNEIRDWLGQQIGAAGFNQELVDALEQRIATVETEIAQVSQQIATLTQELENLPGT